MEEANLDIIIWFVLGGKYPADLHACGLCIDHSQGETCTCIIPRARDQVNNLSYRLIIQACSMGSSLTCVGGLWALLSFISMGLSCVGFYMPFWLKGSLKNSTEAYLGAFRRCNYPKMSSAGEVVIIEQCGRYAEFEDIPSLWWKVTTISVGVGCGLTVLVAFTALLACCMEDVLTKTSAKVGGVLQFLAGEFVIFYSQSFIYTYDFHRDG